MLAEFVSMVQTGIMSIPLNDTLEILAREVVRQTL